MKGKTICITGAGGVLGRAVARATEPRGAVVALAASAVQGAACAASKCGIMRLTERLFEDSRDTFVSTRHYPQSSIRRRTTRTMPDADSSRLHSKRRFAASADWVFEAEAEDGTFAGALGFARGAGGATLHQILQLLSNERKARLRHSVGIAFAGQLRAQFIK